MRKGKNLSNIIIHIVVIIATVVWLLPVFWLVRSSFMDMSSMFQNPPIWIPEKWHFENYKNALTALPFVKYFMFVVSELREYSIKKSASFKVYIDFKRMCFL